MDRAAKMSKLTPPEDRTICTLFVGGVPGAQRGLLPPGGCGRGVVEAR